MKEESLIGLKKRDVSEILNETVGAQKPRFYETSSLSELLCVRYNLSRHTKKQKLIDLVIEELNI